MAGVVLENLSGKQLFALLTFLLAILTGFILVGGYIAPSPTNASLQIATACNKPASNEDEIIETCQQPISSLEEANDVNPDDVVFIARFPLAKSNKMSRWFHFMLVALHFDVEYKDDQLPTDDVPVVELNLTLGYKNEDGEKWQILAKAREHRDLICERPEGYYRCQDMHLFELGNVAHKLYIVNVRLPTKDTPYNKDIGLLKEITMTEIHQNGGFTKVWLSLKTIVSPVSLLLLLWFVRKVKNVRRNVLLLEKSLFGLGMCLVFLNFPVEYLSLAGNMPFMLLLSDFRQGLFYCGLLMFWVIFTGEHILDASERNKIKAYWRELLAIGVGSLCLVLFDLAERGMQITNPFHTIWEKEAGRKAAKGLIYAGGICAGLYFIFLCVMMFRVFRNISNKRSMMPTMMRARRLHYEGIIYRFKFLMLVTILCAALTIVFFIITQVNEVHWKFSDDGETVVELSSAVMTGVYGLWNIYVLTVIYLYAPVATEVRSRFVKLDSGADSTEGIELTTPSETPGEADVSVVYTVAGKTAHE